MKNTFVFTLGLGRRGFDGAATEYCQSARVCTAHTSGSEKSFRECFVEFLVSRGMGYAFSSRSQVKAT